MMTPIKAMFPGLVALGTSSLPSCKPSSCPFVLLAAHGTEKARVLSDLGLLVLSLGHILQRSQARVQRLSILARAAPATARPFQDASQVIERNLAVTATRQDDQQIQLVVDRLSKRFTPPGDLLLKNTKFPRDTYDAVVQLLTLALNCHDDLEQTQAAISRARPALATFDKTVGFWNAANATIYDFVDDLARGWEEMSDRTSALREIAVQDADPSRLPDLLRKLEACVRDSTIWP